MFRQSSVELLAPAGSPEALKAAVRCGADAVYLGGKGLNARRNAGNFSFDELKEAAEYCHARGVKIHLTLNTLVRDDEINTDAENAVRQACEIGADAVIVQDLGLAAYIRESAPELAMHASTQMSIHTLSGVKEAAELGFKRVVLARELSLKEIAEICKASPIEIETFVHGALCMCASGQCLMSAILGGRSANRGLCAQPCRLPFSAPGGTGHDLSLKDLSAIESINELADAGVASLKIEGRMKRPEYVAAAVTVCRKALNGTDEPQLKEKLKSVFSRSGFTNGYLTGQLGKEMFGTRRKEDVTAAQGVLYDLQKLYEKEPQQIPVDLCLTVEAGKRPTLAAKAKDKCVFVTGDTPAQPAITLSLTKEKASQQLKKSGGTPFFVREIECSIDPDISLPLSALNAMRRQALDDIYELLKETKKPDFSPKIVEKQVKKVEKTRFYARFGCMSDVWKTTGADEFCEKIVIPAEKITEKTSPKTVAEIPRAFYGKEDLILNELNRVKSLGCDTAMVSTLDAVRLARLAGMKIILGPGSNIFNSYAVCEAERLGVKGAVLSPELTLGQAAAADGRIEKGLMVYGRLGLMITRNCPIKNGSVSCKDCRGTNSLTDRLGISFPVTCNGHYSEVLNSRPLYMADRLDEISFADFGLIYFTVETDEQRAEVITDFKEKRKPAGEFTRGLYYRGVE